MSDTVQPDAPAFAPVPVIDPAAFEEYEGLRETTLAVFTDAKVNTLLREFVDFVYTVCLEYSKYWPREPEGSFKHQTRAALADLRHLQGYVAMLASSTSTPPSKTMRSASLWCADGWRHGSRRSATPWRRSLDRGRRRSESPPLAPWHLLRSPQ